MAKKRKSKLTKKGKKLKAEVNEALKAAEHIVLDLKKIKKDMMSKFPPSYQGVPYSNCPPPLRRRRRR
jgi:hypothetical protein